MNIFYFLIILYILFVIIIIFSLIFLFFLLQAIITIIRTKVPFAKTPDSNIDKILAELKRQNIPPGSRLYDLGCGNGRVLFEAEKHGYKSIGYELSLYQYLRGLIKKKLNRSKVKIIRKDFMRQDISDADVIFTFLVGGVMSRVGEKLKNNLKKGTIVISYGFAITNWKIDKILETKPSLTYIYRT